MVDSIEKTVDLKAPVERVWLALTDHRQFGEWFRAQIDGPFEVGKTVNATMTYPGQEHVRWTAHIVEMKPERRFAFEWHPGVPEADRDYTKEPRTRVEFRLEATDNGTRLTIVESGFDALPADRRDKAMRDNTNGWNVQANNLASYVGS